MACRKESRDSRTAECLYLVDVTSWNLVTALDFIDMVGEHRGAFCMRRNDNVQKVELSLDDIKVELLARLIEKDIHIVVPNMSFFQVVVLVSVVILH